MQNTVLFTKSSHRMFWNMQSVRDVERSKSQVRRSGNSLAGFQPLQVGSDKNLAFALIYH